jgi:eukaryotic-like serine/threonine-protein kinase
VEWPSLPGNGYKAQPRCCIEGTTTGEWLRVRNAWIVSKEKRKRSQRWIPGIVTVHSVEEVDGIHFLTMQLVEGKSLDKLIPHAGFSLERLLEIATPLADALSAAHERGIIHRDLKPANIMISETGRLRVLDFGLAKVADSSDASKDRSNLSTAMHTREGVAMGTMPYMSPEQIDGREVDSRTDMFSLGVVLLARGEVL